MITVTDIIRRLVLPLLALTCLVTSAPAQVVIPDPGLDAAVRQALQKPTGPLSSQDLLSLTNLDASQRNITNLAGLEAARNLTTLSLQTNSLTLLSVPSELTNLVTIDLSFNPLTNCVFPNGLKHLNRILIQSSQLTNLTLPTNLTVLTELNLQGNQFTSFNLPSNLTGVGFLGLSDNRLTSFTISTNLTELNNLDLEDNQLTSFTLPSRVTNMFFLDLGFNSLTNCTLPNGMAQLDTLFVEANALANLTLPAGMTTMLDLEIWGNQLTSLAIPADMTNLVVISGFFNQLTNLTLPATVRNLTTLDLDGNRLTSFNVPSSLTQLGFLNLRDNQLTNLIVPATITNLDFVDLAGNRLPNFSLPSSPHLSLLNLSSNKLTSLGLPSGMTNLSTLFLQSNQLTNLTLASGLTNLVQIDLRGNQLASLTLPSDLTRLSTLLLDGNPLETLVVSEPMAAARLAGLVASLRNQGVSVFTFPLTVQLVRLLPTAGAFKFAITGPPGVYSVLQSADLATWSGLSVVVNTLGALNFSDTTAHLSPQKFYRALLQSPPPNMVFIPAGTFTMGTPTNEVNHQPDEGPQTTVFITRGFWMGKYEVTQGEYLAVLGSNPSGFPGDLNRPVETVCWLDATNYCARLTQQELAAGHIPPGSRYRLPTEAEWEYAARAGTSTRFSYGDDPNFTNLPNNAWYSANAGFGTHPVGQKAPNPWGLYDMEGNVLEWTLDWYGAYPGGATTDPQGPASNPIGVKVIRGGAWDSFPTDCRSGRRLTEGVSPFITDFILGFRVILVTEP